MRSHSPAVRSVLALAAALFGVAPAARRLVPRAAHPIPYRIGLPEGAEIEEANGLLSARIDHLSVLVVATDMLQCSEGPLPVLEAESRRILTNIIMGSDLLLFALLDEELRSRGLELEQVVRGIGTLGRRRAARVRGRFGKRGVTACADIHATVKDGILYMLAFTEPGLECGSRGALLAGIRDSFVLPG